MHGTDEEGIPVKFSEGLEVLAEQGLADDLPELGGFLLLARSHGSCTFLTYWSSAFVVIDGPPQVTQPGEINVPITNGIFQAADIARTLGEVVIGKKKRAGPDTITIFDSTGLAIQDLAIAKIAMQHGHTVDLPFP